MAWFLPVTHPAASFRNPNLLGPLTAHVENFVYITKYGPPPRPRLERNPSLGRLKKFLRIVFKRRLPLSLDVETGRWGHIARFAELRIIGVGSDIGPGWGLSWDWKTIPFQVKQLLKRAIAHPKVTKLTVNGEAYDKVVLKRYGFTYRGPWHDIKEGRRTVSSTSKVGLGPQASIYLPGIRAWKAEVLEDEDDVKGFVSIGRDVKEKELDYNAEDCVRPAQIWRKQKVELRAGGERTALIYQQLRRLAVVGSEMQYHGFLFDKGEAAKLKKECLEVTRRESAQLRKLIGRRAPDFRITAGGVNENDLRALLFKDCAKPGIKSFGLEVPMDDKCWTDTGSPSVDKTALLYLYAMPDTPQEVREIMRVCWKVDSPLKLISTYIDSEKVRDAIGPDGAVHASINVCAAETYRWSCSKPNLFNLSEQIKDEDEDLRGVLPNARRLYCAPKGRVIVHRDFKALESEVMAEYTGDLALRKMLDADLPTDKVCRRTGKPLRNDVHTNRARLWFGIPQDENAPTQVRKQGKVVGFQSQYAAGCEGVYMKVLEKIQDITFEEVHALWTTFRRVHAGIAQHWGTSLRFALEHGYSEAPIMGYRRNYPDLRQVKDTETSNYAIQGGAAAIANSTIVGIRPEDYARSMHGRLKKEYPDAYFVCHVYDSFDIVCRERDAEGVNQLMDETMQGPWRIGSRLKKYGSDGKIGSRWSDV